MLKNLLFNSLAEAVEKTDQFQYVIHDVPMFENSEVQTSFSDLIEEL